MTVEDVSRPAGDVLWRPRSDWRESTRVGRYVEWLRREGVVDVGGYDELWQWSVDELESFWQSIWDHFGVIAHDHPTAVLAERRMPGARWFTGATMNFAEQALHGADEQVVIVARSQTRGPIEMTRGELRDAVARARAGLVRLGVGRGDRVAGYLPNIPETVVALLATTSLGAIWSGCAPEFGTRSVLDRLQQIEPKVLIAADGYRYGGREIDRAEDVEAIRAGLPTLKATVRVPYLRQTAPAEGIAWEQLLAHPAAPAYEPVAFEHPLWVLFSSGTTGLPKAIVHGHGGIVLELLKSHALQSDLGETDRYFIFAPTGWVIWNILVAGLMVGAAIVLMDGDPVHPDRAELWRTIAETETTSFACGATLLMMARAGGLDPRSIGDLSRLRGISSTGSPLPAEGFRWVYEHVGEHVYLQSSSGGTDVCTGFVGGSPILPVRAGRIACRLLGVNVQAFDPTGRRVVGQLGELVVVDPMPSMPVCFWNDPGDERYRQTYFTEFPGRWRHGDWIRFDEDGSCVITGRSDATLNRGGVRLGTSEFYAVIEEFPQIEDSLVVHLEDPSGGLGQLLLFVVMAEDAELDDELRTALDRALRSRLSPRHRPDQIHTVRAIPYNLTGKKLEIPVKRIFQGADRASVLNDGAVRDPSCLEEFEEMAKEFLGGRRDGGKVT